MAERPAFLDNSIIIACHPDDELLWFGSILADVDRVMLVYEDYWADPALGPARAAALANHPRADIETLAMPEIGTALCGDWAGARIDDVGMAFHPAVRLRDAKQAAKRALGRAAAPAGSVAQRYGAQFDHLLSHLRESLRADMNVFTHNPWGEYGHEDHVQLFRVLDRLRGEIGFRLWMSNYVTERSLPLARRYFEPSPAPGLTLPVDAAYCERVADCYRETGCWTWAQAWSWFPTETFREAPRGPRDAGPQAHLGALNLFAIG